MEYKEYARCRRRHSLALRGGIAALLLLFALALRFFAPASLESLWARLSGSGALDRAVAAFYRELESDQGSLEEAISVFYDALDSKH